MIRLIILSAVLGLRTHAGDVNKIFAIPAYEKEGHLYRIPTDNVGEQNIFSTIAIHATKNSGLFAEYNESTHCAEFFSPRTYEKKCDGIFFLLHADHYIYVRYKLSVYLMNKEKTCRDPVLYRDTLLVLDKPDRLASKSIKPKYVGNFIEKDNTISYILDGKPVVIELVKKKIAGNLLPEDRIEMLCRMPKV